MRLAVLFSGGKDSTLALFKAMDKEEVVSLISIVSENEASYMFHTPNIGITRLQAEAIGLPLIQEVTEGRQEVELEDLKRAIITTKKEYKVDGVVTGAIESVYQTERIQKICHDVDLWCFNPLWKKDQQELLKEIVKDGIRAIVSGVFAYPLNKLWLGKEIDEELIQKLVEVGKEYGLSPSGEGGEIETSVLDAPFFKKKIEVVESETRAKGNTGVFMIKKGRLIEK